MACKGICERYKAKRDFAIGHYRVHQKWRQVCRLFLDHDGVWHPCRHQRLRSHPRSLGSKRAYRDEHPIVRIA